MKIIGEWSNKNLSIPDTINRTLVEEARKEFDFGGVGTFSLNLKSTATQNKDINYLQVKQPREKHAPK
jgi:hypothetical protein